MKEISPYRVSVRKFQRMIAANAFGEDRVELLGGILTMMTTSPEHDFVVLARGRGVECQTATRPLVGSS